MLVDDGDGHAARGLQHHGIGRLALAEYVLALVQLAALHIGGDAGKIDLTAELGLQPALEGVGRGVADLVIHEQHVLAPFDRLVAAAENLMRPRAAEEAGLLEAGLHDLVQARKSEPDVMLLAIVAELDEAQDRRSVEARNSAEVEHHEADRLLQLPFDDPLDALEQTVRRAEKNEAGEPEHVDALALLAQQARLLGRALDIGRELLPREVPADDANAAIAQRKHQTRGDDTEHHPREVANIGDDEHNRKGERPVHPGRTLRRRSGEFGEEDNAKIGKHAAKDRFRHYGAHVYARKQNDGADNADDRAGPLRGGARLVEQETAIHRQRAAKSAEHRSKQIGEAVGTKFLVEIARFLPRHFQARNIEQERDCHHATKRADVATALEDDAPVDPMP